MAPHLEQPWQQFDQPSLINISHKTVLPYIVSSKNRFTLSYYNLSSRIF